MLLIFFERGTSNTLIHIKIFNMNYNFGLGDRDRTCITPPSKGGTWPIKLRPDISFMSDSQLSMISMIISFALLHKASESYNIIKLDEVDNNLDNDNRLQFSVLVERIMAILNFHQCVIISHNNEIDLSNVDMIVFKIENPSTLASLMCSGANIIFSYHQ